MTIEEIAMSHLGTVRNAVNDLFAQKEKIDQEIAKLKEYITNCENVISDYQHVNSQNSNKEVGIRGL
jgi:prefoldin subunit 5